MAATIASDQSVVGLERVRVWTAEGAELLRDITWSIDRGQHWALLGPNGAGKSTLLAVIAGNRFPSSGAVALFGGRLGEVDIRAIRPRIGIVNPTRRMYDWMTIRDTVLTGTTGTSLLLPGTFTNEDVRRAGYYENLMGLASLSERSVGTCSQGEQQRVRLARALMAGPEILLLDEPASGLDLPAREALLAALNALCTARPELTTILVSHHLEELPTTTTHACLIAGGRVIAAGAATDILTAAPVSECFGVPIEIEHSNGRWYARAQASWIPGGQRG